MRKLFSILVLLLGLLGVAFSYMDIDVKSEVRPAKPLGHLERAIPAIIGSFESKEVPLGETEEVVRAAKGTLSFSEFMNRSYTDKSGLEFSLYISYWAEGRESISRATVHTPDRCWVTNGWKNTPENRTNNYVLTSSIMPAYYREMDYDISKRQTIRRNVWFWFIADGQRYDYGKEENLTPSITKYIQNVLVDAFENSPECYFIRIDSSSDLKQFLDNEDFMALLDCLGELILSEKGDKEDES